MALPFPCAPILDPGGPNAGPPPSASWINAVGYDGLVTVGGQFAIDPASVGLHPENVALWGTQTGANCESYLSVPTRCADGQAVYVLARTSNPPLADGYVVAIFRSDGGGDVFVIANETGPLATWPVVFDDGDGLGLRCCGSTISGWHYKIATGWVEIGSVISVSTTTGGYIGMAITADQPPIAADLATRLDNYGGGDIDSECCGTFPPPIPTPRPATRTLPTASRQAGLSIDISDPLVWGATRSYHETITGQLARYSHEIRAIGGYQSAEIVINDDQSRIEDWIERGIGRHIEVKDEYGVTVWEGFVNEVVANLAKATITLTPLMDTGNKVAQSYSTIDNSVSPPIMGVTATTAWASDTDSQARYGIIEKNLAGGGMTATEALRARDRYLSEHAWPAASQDNTYGRGGQPQVTLSCLGYWAWLFYVTYSNTATGTQNLSAKITAVLGASPNAVFSTDYNLITANTWQVDQYENDRKSADTILKALNGLGDAADNRYNIGFYAGRKLKYAPAPSSIYYQQRLAGNTGLVVGYNLETKPWAVHPAEWLFFPDLLTGRIPPVTTATLERDPRAGHIEVVQYTAPWGLTVNGQKISRLDQMLAKLGLAGVGA